MKTQPRVLKYGELSSFSWLGFSLALALVGCALPAPVVSETIQTRDLSNTALNPASLNQHGAVAAANLRAIINSQGQLASSLRTQEALDSDEPHSGLVYARFEHGELNSADLESVVQAINEKTSRQFKPEEFRLTDDVDLLNERYFRFEQVSNGVAVESSSIRIWVGKQASQGAMRLSGTDASPLLVEAFLTPILVPELAPEAAASQQRNNMKNGNKTESLSENQESRGGSDRRVHKKSTHGSVPTKSFEDFRIGSKGQSAANSVEGFEHIANETPEKDFSDVTAIVRKDLSHEFATGAVLRIKKSNIAFADQRKQKLILLRRIDVKLREGSIVFDFENNSTRLLRKFFKDSGAADASMSLAARVYPLWELTNADVAAGAADALAVPTEATLPRILERVPAPHLRSVLGSRSLSFLESKKKDGPLSPADIFAGYWNQDFLNFLFPKPWEKQVVQLPNQFGYGLPVRLFGKNVIVMLHQDVSKNFPASSQKSFTSAPQYSTNYEEIPGSDGSSDSKFTYVPLKWGKAVLRANDLLERSPFGSDGKAHPDDTVSLIDAGFDEAQVYYSTDTFMDTLQNLGFADAELSTRPFTAILFDPAIEARDNAYYDADTINFTTYSSTEMNMARDSSTIWHELGHGIQDRLMGPHVDSSEGYGLWEGMADFIAQIVISQKFGIEPFSKRETLRILNTTQFYLTNESHDEGEAYGGAMNTMLEMMIRKYGGAEGVLRMTDLTLETMRLTRDHPKLTAEVWFEQMKYVDTLPRDTLVAARVPGELNDIIVAALSSRNYNPGQEAASFEVSYQAQALTDRSAGSRSSPITVDPSLGAVQNFELELKLQDGTATQFSYPVTIKAAFRGGPLQGAMKWLGEENGPKIVTIAGPGEKVSLPLQVDTSACDFANRSDGGCRDFVYLQVFNAGEETTGKPVGKKRFYLQKKGAAISPEL